MQAMAAGGQDGQEGAASSAVSARSLASGCHSRGGSAVSAGSDTGTCRSAVYNIHYRDASGGTSHLPFLAVSLAAAREAAGLEETSLGMKHKTKSNTKVVLCHDIVFVL